MRVEGHPAYLSGDDHRGKRLHRRKRRTDHYGRACGSGRPRSDVHFQFGSARPSAQSKTAHAIRLLNVLPRRRARLYGLRAGLEDYCVAESVGRWRAAFREMAAMEPLPHLAHKAAPRTSEVTCHWASACGRPGTDGEGLARRAGYRTISVPLIIYALEGRLSRAQRRPDDAIRRLSRLAAH
jgi:hypothetical protein